MLTQSERDELEALIDKHSIEDVVIALDLVCQEKSEHVLINWQDKNLSKAWTRVGGKLTIAARAIEGLIP